MFNVTIAQRPRCVGRCVRISRGVTVTPALPRVLNVDFNLFVSVLPQSIMLRWQPPPLSGQNGEITSYKIRYRKGYRRSEAAETTAGTQLVKLIDGKGNGNLFVLLCRQPGFPLQCKRAAFHYCACPWRRHFSVRAQNRLRNLRDPSELPFGVCKCVCLVGVCVSSSHGVHISHCTRTKCSQPTRDPQQR